MKSINAPQARPRSRAGMLPLDWARAPSVEDMWPDKVDISVRGRVSWPDGTSFHGYLTAIGQRSAFKNKPTVGRTFKSEIDFGSVKGEVRIDMAVGHRADEPLAGEAGVSLRLYLNPTRTRAHAVRRNSAPLDQINLRQFFKPIASSEEVFEEGNGFEDRNSLDGTENFFWNAEEAGGTTPTARARARDDFLLLYQVRLQDLVRDLFTLDSGTRDSDNDAAILQPASVSFSWSDLHVTYAEIYAERSAWDPVEVMHRLHDRGLSLARDIRASKFTGATTACAYETNNGFSHIVIPLTRQANFDISVYAKTPRRTRFEVRYRREFSRIIRCASTGAGRLSSALGLLLRDAATRVPWQSLGRAARDPSSTGRNDVLELMIALQTATRDIPAAFAPLVRSLIQTGGIHNDESKVPGIEKAIASLVKTGVLEHWQTQKKEARRGRRYGLTQRFFDARFRVLAGFAPPQSQEEHHVAPPGWEPSTRQPQPIVLRKYARDRSQLERQRAILRRNGLTE